jgi:diguanylate cyclase (GGDEF)-like protein
MKRDILATPEGNADISLIEAEAERLLSGRTRDIRFSKAMHQLFREKSWPQRSKIVRAWAIWVTLIDIAFIPISYLLIPKAFALSVVVGLVFFPAAHACLYWIWTKPRAAWIEGLSIVAIISLLIAAFGSLGAAEAGANSERILTGAMYVATIAIVVLNIELVWSTAIAVCSIMIYFGYEILNPAIEPRVAIGSTLYYAMGLFAVVAARRTAMILSQKGFLMSLRDQYRSKALTRANAQLETLAKRDPLTGLANRRFASERIAAIWRDPTVLKSRVAVIMVDIDHFKLLNDAAGHAVGDDCIFRVARSIEASVRAKDVVCRYGGEEFLIVLIDVTPATAWAFAERIRSDVEAMAIVNPGLGLDHPLGGNVTVSVGVAFARDGAKSELVVKSADDALYDAKHAGRNRVFLAIARDVDAIEGNDIPEQRPPMGAPPTEAPPKVL